MNSESMTTKEFSWSTGSPTTSSPGTTAAHFGTEVLCRNAAWFITLRWVVVGVFVCYQILSWAFPQLHEFFGFSPPRYWPLVLSTFLSIANLAAAHALRERDEGGRPDPVPNLWGQVIVDLISVTIVVHFLGSIGSPAPLLYVGHIALACVFFSSPQSLGVTLACMGLLWSLVATEFLFDLPSPMLRAVSMAGTPARRAAITLLISALVGQFYLVTWYLVSRLSTVIRLREADLREAHTRIWNSQRERDIYIMKMTHEFKAPLDSVRGTISLMRTGYLGALPSSLGSALDRIERIAGSMSELILDMLGVARMRLERGGRDRMELHDIGEIVSACGGKLKPIAEAKGITLTVESEGAMALCDYHLMGTMVQNLLSNALCYSRPGGRVSVTCSAPSPDHGPVLEVSDQGIGIDKEEMADIFDDFFRGARAREHNESSTGTGLSIVRGVAETHNLTIVVSSAIDQGTTVKIVFPKPPASGGSPGRRNHA